jgi:hypothetical protein
MNWFSFRYWWFVWLIFLLAILLFVFKCCKHEKPTSCSDKYNFNERYRTIDSLLNNCCDCMGSVDSSIVQRPDNIIPCDESVPRNARGENSFHSQPYELGPNPGNIALCYFTGNVYPDNIKVLYDGQVLFESGMVLTGENEDCQNIRYDYRPGKPTYVTVTVEPSTSFETRWTYRLGCPH